MIRNKYKKPISIFSIYLNCLDEHPGDEALPSIQNQPLLTLISDLSNWIDTNVHEKERVNYNPYLLKLRNLWQVLNCTGPLNNDEGLALIELLLGQMANVENAIFWQYTKDDPYMCGDLVNRDKLRSSVVGKFLLHIVPKLAVNEQDYLFRHILEILRSSTKTNIPKPFYYHAQQMLAKLLGEERIIFCCEYYLKKLDEDHVDSACYDVLPILLNKCSEEYRQRFFEMLVEKLVAYGAFRVKQKNLQYLFVKIYDELPSEIEKQHIYENIIVPMQLSPHSFLRQSLTEIIEKLDIDSESSLEILNQLANDPDKEVQRFANQSIENLLREKEVTSETDSSYSEEEFFSEDAEFTSAMPKLSSKQSKAVDEEENRQIQEFKAFEKSLISDLKCKCIAGLNSENSYIREYAWEQLSIRYLAAASSDQQKQAWVNIIFDAFLKPNFALGEFQLVDYIFHKLLPIKSIISVLINRILSMLQVRPETTVYRYWSNLLEHNLLNAADAIQVAQAVKIFAKLILDNRYSSVARENFLDTFNSICSSRPEYRNTALSCFVTIINQQDRQLREMASELLQEYLYDAIENQPSDKQFFETLCLINLNKKIKDDWQFQEMIENLFGFLVSVIAKNGNSQMGNYAASTLRSLIQQTKHCFYADITNQLLKDYGVYALESLTDLRKTIKYSIQRFKNNHIGNIYYKLEQYLDNHQLQQAAEKIARLEKNYFFLPRLRFYQAEIKFRNHQYSSAIEDYNYFIKIQPYYVQAKIRLFQCYHNLGTFHAAQRVREALALMCPQLQLPNTSDNIAQIHPPLLTFEHTIQHATIKLEKFSQESLHAIRSSQSSDDASDDKRMAMEKTIIVAFERLKQEWAMYFGEKVINSYLDSRPAIEWSKLINYPHQFQRYMRDLFLGILNKVIPEYSVQYYDIYYRILEKMRSLDSHIVDSEILPYVSHAANPREFLQSQFEVYSAYDFMREFAFTTKFKDACALGLSDDISSAYNLLVGLLQLKHWELVYHEVQVEPSGTTAHTNEFLQKVLERGQTIIMFVPTIVKKADINNPTLDEIKYLLEKASQASLKGKVYLVFGAYDFLPIYIQHINPITNKPSPGASFKVILDHLISFFNITIGSAQREIHFRNLIVYMLKTRIHINVNAELPADRILKEAIEKDLIELFNHQLEFLTLVKCWLDKLPRIIRTVDNGLVRYVSHEWRNFKAILNLIDALLFTDLPWVNAEYQLPNLDFIHELEETLELISTVFDDDFRRQVFQTNNIDNYLEIIRKFLDYLSILKEDITQGLRWKCLDNNPDSSIRASVTTAPNSSFIKPQNHHQLLPKSPTSNSAVSAEESDITPEELASSAFGRGVGAAKKSYG